MLPFLVFSITCFSLVSSECVHKSKSLHVLISRGMYQKDNFPLKGSYPINPNLEMRVDN